MKKKHVAIIAFVAIILVGAIGFFGLTHVAERYVLSEGNIVFSKTGDAIFLGENGPFVMSDGSKKGELFAEFNDGDGVKTIHGAINETYPGQTVAYYAKKTDHTMDNEARADIDQLKELGWLYD